MVYEKLRGDHLFDGENLHGNDKILIIHHSGKSEVVHESDAGDEIKYIPGLIRPGFANVHCHLELSHMKGVLPEHTGLVSFLMGVIKQRNISESDVQHAIQKAIEELKEDGIIAVGDICNNTSTIVHKSKADIHWTNFIEILSLTDANADNRIKQNIELKDQFLRAGLKNTVISPHAPYSISKETFIKINEITAGQTITIHNQESQAENDLYTSGSGQLLELYQQLGYIGSPIQKTGTNSIKSILPYFNKGQKIILVHNTFMSDSDIQWAKNYAQSGQIELVFCLCINANLYIENRTPDISAFIKNDCKIVLGTDSYSSNWNLKISEEIKTIHQKFPSIPIQDLLKWATTNGLNTLKAPIQWIKGSKLMEEMGYTTTNNSGK